jgi:hypothetical protein
MDHVLWDLKEVKSGTSWLCYEYAEGSRLYKFICKFDNEKQAKEYRDDTRRINSNRKEIYIIKERAIRTIIK